MLMWGLVQNTHKLLPAYQEKRLRTRSDVLRIWATMKDPQWQISLSFGVTISFCHYCVHCKLVLM